MANPPPSFLYVQTPPPLPLWHQQEDTIDSLSKIYRSGEAQPFLPLILACVIAFSFLNSSLLVTLVKAYGAATARVLLSGEVPFTWCERLATSVRMLS
jgi:hypothetical protein